ncbi:tuftelin-like [Acipenser oxyrinchus oxyrinchus]|uniref:Tuftelin-like n=1 Tax=Acipenser oxyrinchus oxyrinchus TaxID=40147 RepID=A0AAD8CNE5_ACIOX|nr:tuftelin-like [Acipenser oxyrinchus oxyrinchus]
MNGMSRSLYARTITELKTDNDKPDGVRRLRLTLQNQSEAERSGEQTKTKPIRRAFAVVPSNGISSSQPTEEGVEIIKVYVEARRKDQASHENNMRMLSDEVTQIQEVRYCLKNLRQQMAARTNGRGDELKTMTDTNGLRPPSTQSHAVAHGNQGAPRTLDHSNGQAEGSSEPEPERMRELTKKLYSQFHSKLQETERRHSEEKRQLESRSSAFQRELTLQGEALRRAEEGLGERDGRIEDLQRLLSGMEREHSELRERMSKNEGQLQEISLLKQRGEEHQSRSGQLEKEVSSLKEKIHHLDDMLKSQQRKVRHMIEQLQNSKTLIRDKDALIHKLQEKVSVLEAENWEMQHRLDFFTGAQDSSPCSTETLHSKRPPLTAPNKSVIKVLGMAS